MENYRKTKLVSQKNIRYNSKICFLNESSLSRILTLIKKFDFACISAFRSNLTKRENLKRTEKLESELKSLGLSFVKIIGTYQEKGMDKPSIEKSFLVINSFQRSDYGFEEFKKYMIEFAKRYDQDSVLINKVTDNGVAHLYNQESKIADGKDDNGKKIKYFDTSNLTLSNFGNFISSYKGRQFKFKEIVESCESEYLSESYINAISGFSFGSAHLRNGMRSGLQIFFGEKQIDTYRYNYVSKIASLYGDILCEKYFRDFDEALIYANDLINENNRNVHRLYIVEQKIRDKDNKIIETNTLRNILIK